MSTNEPDYSAIIAQFDTEENWFRSVDIGPGWADLVLDLHAKLVELHPDYKIYQVKEKFGGLRYYTDVSHTSPGGDLIREAESKSFTICEVCGEPGELRNPRFWMRTLCDTHAAEDDKDRG